MMSVTTMLTENVAGISAAIHQHPQYMEFYKACAEDVSGFPGIWTLAAEVGKAFTDAEVNGRYVAGDDYDWIEAIDEMSSHVIESWIAPDASGSRDWRKVANMVIEKNAFND